MRTNINKKQDYKSNLMLVLNTIEKLLIKSFVFLMLLLLISQILLYYKLGNGYLNSIYKMEGNLFSTKSESIYTLFCIYGEVPKSDNIWVLKNGIPIGQITSDTPVYINIFEGDMIEIDATSASGIPREIFIKKITSNAVSKGFSSKMVLTDKFYRLQPFYSS